VGTAEVVSYLWLKLTESVLGYPEVYICVCYMPQKKDFIDTQKLIPTVICRYECLQNDAVEYQSRGAQILVCGHLNAGTAEKPGILKAELQPFLPTASDDDKLPAQPPRHNCDTASGLQTWGPELLGFCQPNNILLVKGRTLGNEYGQFIFQTAKCH